MKRTAKFVKQSCSILHIRKFLMRLIAEKDLSQVAKLMGILIATYKTL